MAPQGHGQMPHSAGAVPGSAGGYQSQTSSDGGWALVFEIGQDPAWLRKAMAKCPTVLEQYQVALVDTRVKLAATADGLSSLKSDETRHGSARV